jgi:hypothetical protein
VPLDSTCLMALSSSPQVVTCALNQASHERFGELVIMPLHEVVVVTVGILAEQALAEISIIVETKIIGFGPKR